MSDPDDVTTDRLRALRAACTDNPGDVALEVVVCKTRCTTPHRVHVGPPFLKALKEMAPASWVWNVLQKAPPPPRRSTPPPPRRT